MISIRELKNCFVLYGDSVVEFFRLSVANNIFLPGQHKQEGCLDLRNHFFEKLIRDGVNHEQVACVDLEALLQRILPPVFLPKWYRLRNREVVGGDYPVSDLCEGSKLGEKFLLLS